VKVSRLIQPVLKGDLDGKVETFPAFPGLEKHLLKSLIVRITYGSVICPKGVYRTNEENGKYFIPFKNKLGNEIEFEEEFKMPEMSELSNLENWVH
jgi:hypothetical protein